MKGRFLLPFFNGLLICLSPGLSQGEGTEVISFKIETDSVVVAGFDQEDTLKNDDIIFSREQAIRFLENKHRNIISKRRDEPLYSAIRQLIYEASNPPYNSTRTILEEFISDSTAKLIDEYYKRKPAIETVQEDTVFKNDTTFLSIKTDTLLSAGISIRKDSIKTAIGVLLDFLEVRDSSIISFKGTDTKTYSLWMNSISHRMIRFWLKNDLNDSVTVWIGNPSRDTIGLYLEQGVSFRRPSRQGYVTEARIDIEKLDNRKLVGIQDIITKSKFWRYRTEASFALNQGLLTNWVKGGEGNVSTTFDITWYADYSNKPILISSNHFARIKYGLIKTGDEKIRKNLDLLETNSKFNHKAFGKFDFSAIMLFKTQVSKGYNYPNDSVAVSKLMNPAILTLGFGLDYKPNKLTSINFSPLSYKATFVPDTASIDQTKYGIAIDRRSKHEPGASFLISNEFKPFRTVTVTNRLQLFTNYINNPLNIDVDWEMILKASLNWFTDLRLNTHLIFDDDTRTPVFDKDKNPVLGDDGLQKKTARIQFKELLGLSFVFRF